MEPVRVIDCTCGAVLEGTGSDDAVSNAQVHAREVHDMDLSREQALEMMRPA